MTETYFLGGYYLVESSSDKSWINQSLIPKKFYSLSNCICSHHPDISVLPWVNDAEDRERYRQKLRLSIEEFLTLQTQVDKWFGQDRYAWGEVFLDLNLAREFAGNYLSHIQDIKLLAIATTTDYRTLFLEESASGNNEVGISKALKSNQTIKIEHGFLGYEILGHEFGWFHSFVCNHLENDFANKLNIEFNQHGLIDRYDLAIKASNYTNREDTGAEPVLWLPWAIVELDIFS